MLNKCEELESLQLDFPNKQRTLLDRTRTTKHIKSKYPDKKNNELEENLHLGLRRHCRRRLLKPLWFVFILCLVWVSGFFFGFAFFVWFFVWLVSSALSDLFMELERVMLNFYA